MKRTIKDHLLLLWAVRGPDWILPLMLASGILATAGLVLAGMSASKGAPMGAPVTIYGTVDRFTIQVGRFSRNSLVQATVEGRTQYFTLSITADCQPGDRIELTKRSRPFRSPLLFPAMGQPCRRPSTPFRH
jgi:hypothetical protein